MKDVWEMKRLKVMSDIMYGHTAKASFDIQGPKYLRITDIQNHTVNWETVPNCSTLDNNKYKLVSGDVVFARTGATTGKSFLIRETPNNAVFASYLIRVQINSPAITPEFLYLYFQTPMYWNTIKKGVSGSAQGGFNAKKLGELNIPIPPIAEQKQIVSILHQVFELIDKVKSNIKRNLHNAQELFQSKLNDVFSQKGDGWEEKKLGAIANFKNGLNFKKSSQGDQIKLVGVSNFQDFFYLKPNQLQEVQIDGNLDEHYELKDGDILTVRSNGNPNLIGRCILAKGVNEITSHSGFTIRIRPNTNIIHPPFLCHLLKSTKTRKELINSGNGLNIKSLNQKTLSQLNINYPFSMKDQQKISEELSHLSTVTQKLESSYIHKLNVIQELKNSILQKAFTGELTSTILEQIET